VQELHTGAIQQFFAIKASSLYSWSSLKPKFQKFGFASIAIKNGPEYTCKNVFYNFGFYSLFGPQFMPVVILPGTWLGKSIILDLKINVIPWRTHLLSLRGNLQKKEHGRGCLQKLCRLHHFFCDIRLAFSPTLIFVESRRQHPGLILARPHPLGS
jgi:hypothetical protein